jgi:hypothetical protein
VDWSPNHADLVWDPPASDGGAPITHYIIEMKEKNMGQWVEGKTLTVKEVEELGNKIKGRCDGLVEGHEYQFRIRAVNKGGPSKPGPPSESMIAKHRFIPPHLIGDGIYDITLKKGRPIRYDLWFGGEPAPSVEWLRNGRTLGNDDHTSIELYSKNTIYTERNTVLSIPKVRIMFATTGIQKNTNNVRDATNQVLYSTVPGTIGICIMYSKVGTYVFL